MRTGHGAELEAPCSTNTGEGKGGGKGGSKSKGGGKSAKQSKQQHDGASMPSAPSIPRPPTCTTYGAGPTVRVLDLACGSGEATQAIAAWFASRRQCQSSCSSGLQEQPRSTQKEPQGAEAGAHREEGRCGQQGPPLQSTHAGQSGRDAASAQPPPSEAPCAPPPQEGSTAPPDDLPVLQTVTDPIAESGEGPGSEHATPSLALSLPAWLQLSVDATDPYTQVGRRWGWEYRVCTCGGRVHNECDLVKERFGCRAGWFWPLG